MHLLTHIYGIPVEEMLMPLGGVSMAVLTASVARRVHLVRRALHQDRDRRTASTKEPAEFDEAQ